MQNRMRRIVASFGWLAALIVASGARSSAGQSGGLLTLSRLCRLVGGRPYPQPDGAWLSRPVAFEQRRSEPLAVNLAVSRRGRRRTL